MRAEAPRSGHRLISRTAPTHWRDPIAFFAEAAEVESRTLWLRPATGEALVGLGSAVTLVGYGADRFEQVMAEWRAEKFEQFGKRWADAEAILRYLAYCGGIGAEVVQTGAIAVNDEIIEV